MRFGAAKDDGVCILFWWWVAGGKNDDERTIVRLGRCKLLVSLRIR